MRDNFAVRLASVATLFVLVCAILFAGCVNQDQKKLFDVMQGTLSTVSTKIAEKGLGQYQVSGQVIEPGMRAEVGVSFYLETKLTGTAGQIMAAGQGQFSELTPEQEEQIFQITHDTALSREEQRKRIHEVVMGIGRYIDKNTEPLRQVIYATTRPAATARPATQPVTD